MKLKIYFNNYSVILKTIIQLERGSLGDTRYRKRGSRRGSAGQSPVLFIWSISFIWLIWSVRFVWSVLSIWLNETNQINQMNQRNQRDQACPRCADHRGSAVPKWFFRACGLASGRTSFASSRTAMSDRLLDDHGRTLSQSERSDIRVCPTLSVSVLFLLPSKFPWRRAAESRCQWQEPNVQDRRAPP